MIKFWDDMIDAVGTILDHWLMTGNPASPNQPQRLKVSQLPFLSTNGGTIEGFLTLEAPASIVFQPGGGGLGLYEDRPTLLGSSVAMMGLRQGNPTSGIVVSSGIDMVSNDSISNTVGSSAITINTNNVSMIGDSVSIQSGRTAISMDGSNIAISAQNSHVDVSGNYVSMGTGEGYIDISSETMEIASPQITIFSESLMLPEIPAGSGTDIAYILALNSNDEIIKVTP